MTTRLHINISQGLFEVEGEEPFVREMYEEFKAELAQKPIQSAGSAKEGKNPKNKAAASNASKGGAAKKKVGEPKIDKNLDLSGVGGAEPLQEYYARYKPGSNLVRNVVFVGYLKEVMKFDKVGVDQVWTCYDYMKIKFPGQLRQSLIDAGRDKGGSRLNTGSLDDLSLSVHGRNWLLGNEKEPGEQK